MSAIADCRTDDHYNEKFLSGDYKAVICGYDAAIGNVKSLFHNLEVYQKAFDVDGEDINLIRFLNNHPRVKDLFMKAIVDSWLESGRNLLITTMIDEMEKANNEIKISFTTKRG
ncbi:MAG: hypothetical protein LUH47_05400 [Clostridiales bacterium]|nr:hypothetical protein [Clostridiales bacterium]